MEPLSSCRIPATRNAVYVGFARYDREGYDLNHPLLDIPRASLTFDLINAYGAFAEGEYLAGPTVPPDLLRTHHSPDYIDALRESEELGFVRSAVRERYNIGTMENPWFPELYTLPALMTGCSIRAAEEVIRGRTAFSPTGGMHHAKPDRASGFGYLNDGVLAIHRLREEGLRVLYVDIDAHHGDGVERAFADDPEVFTFSLHMDTGYAFPFTGGRLADQGGPGGEASCLNVPLPKGTHDADYDALFTALWPRVLADFLPDVVVLEPGTDAIGGDPLGKLEITTQQFLRIVERIHRDSPRLLVLGGGGYHPLLLARAWAGVWGILSGRDLPEAIPEAGQALLAGVEWDLADDEEDERFVRSRLDEAVDRPLSAEPDRILEEARRLHPRLRGL
ncbi:MAG: acetoin utilization protein AcuC [Thiohalorhabdus sp.]